MSLRTRPNREFLIDEFDEYYSNFETKAFSRAYTFNRSFMHFKLFIEI